MFEFIQNNEIILWIIAAIAGSGFLGVLIYKSLSTVFLTKGNIAKIANGIDRLIDKTEKKNPELHQLSSLDVIRVFIPIVKKLSGNLKESKYKQEYIKLVENL